MPSKPFILVFLAALLLAVSSAPAASAAPSATPFAATGELEVGDEVPEEDEEAEEGEEEAEETECEEAVDEFAEGEISGEERDEICKAEAEEWEKAAAAGVLPEVCTVRTFHPTAVASTPHNQVLLTIGYTAYESTDAKIGYGFKGGPSLGTAKRHLGEQGTLHLDKRLSDSQMAKLQSANKLTVQIDVPETPARCKSFYAVDLSASHASKSRTTFLPRRKRS